MRDDVICPHCGDVFEANEERCHLSHGVMKANECLQCGSLEIQHRIEGSMLWQVQTGWEGPCAFEGPPAWVHDLACRMYSLGVQYGLKNADRVGNAPPDSLAPAMRAV